MWYSVPMLFTVTLAIGISVYEARFSPLHAQQPSEERRSSDVPGTAPINQLLVLLFEQQRQVVTLNEKVREMEVLLKNLTSDISKTKTEVSTLNTRLDSIAKESKKVFDAATDVERTKSTLLSNIATFDDFKTKVIRDLDEAKFQIKKLESNVYDASVVVDRSSRFNRDMSFVIERISDLEQRVETIQRSNAATGKTTSPK